MMNENQFKEVLIKIAEEKFPAGAYHLPYLEKERIKQSQLQRSVFLRPVFAGLPLWAAVFLAVIFISGSAYALYKGLSAHFNDPGLAAVEEKSLQTSVEETVTLEGISLTLHWVYADVNRVSAAYTLLAEDPAATLQNYILMANWYDAAGNLILAPGGGPGGTAGNSGEGLLSFSLPEDLQQENRLDLRLDLSLVSLPGSQGSGPLPDIGPFSFSFQVLLNPGLVLEPAETQSAQGISVTLKRLVITPSMTRAEVCYTVLPGGENLQPFAWLDSGQELFPLQTYELNPVENGQRCSRWEFLSAYEQLGPQWRLLISAFEDPNTAWQPTPTPIEGSQPADDLPQTETENPQRDSPWIFMINLSPE